MSLSHDAHAKTLSGDALRQGMMAAELAGLRRIGTAGASAAEFYADWISESASFIAERLREEARAQHALLHCRSTQDLEAIHWDFWQKAIDEYRAYGARLASLLQRHPADVPKPRENGHATPL